MTNCMDADEGKLRVLWIDDKPDANFVKNPPDCLTVVRLEGKGGTSSLENLADFIKLFKAYKDGKANHVLPADIILLDYSLDTQASRTFKMLSEKEEADEIAELLQSLPDNGVEEEKDTEGKGESGRSDLNFLGLIMGVFYAASTVNYPTVIRPFTQQRGLDGITEIEALHEMGEKFLEIDFTKFHKSPRDWHEVLTDTLRPFRDRMKDLYKKGRITLDLDDLLHFDEPGRLLRIGHEYRGGKRVLSIDALFSDIIEDVLYIYKDPTKAEMPDEIKREEIIRGNEKKRKSYLLGRKKELANELLSTFCNTVDMFKDAFHDAVCYMDGFADQKVQDLLKNRFALSELTAKEKAGKKGAPSLDNKEKKQLKALVKQFKDNNGLFFAGQSVRFNWNAGRFESAEKRMEYTKKTALCVLAIFMARLYAQRGTALRGIRDNPGGERTARVESETDITLLDIQYILFPAPETPTVLPYHADGTGLPKKLRDQCMPPDTDTEHWFNPEDIFCGLGRDESGEKPKYGLSSRDRLLMVKVFQDQLLRLVDHLPDLTRLPQNMRRILSGALICRRRS